MKRKVKLTAAEKAIIIKAVQIMRRICKDSKMCDYCPAVHVFCSGNRKRLPKDWEVPFYESGKSDRRRRAGNG